MNFHHWPSLYLVLFLFVSCANLKRDHKEKKRGKQKSFYTVEDFHGKFHLSEEKGVMKNGKVYLRSSLFHDTLAENKVIEKIIVLSDSGSMRLGEKKLNVLRPKVSQYTVWLDGQKHFTQMKLIPEQRKLEVITQSPGLGSAEETLAVPSHTQLLCFYSQVVDCLARTNFFSMAEKYKRGEAKLTIIWEGHPFFHEQYTNLPKEVFSEAVMRYEGKDSNGNSKYSLNTLGQNIFYLLGPSGRVVRKSWVSQGMSQVLK